MISPEVEDALADCFARHNVPEYKQKLILQWFENASIAQGLMENVRTGTMDVVGIVKGEPRFSLTEQGKKYVESMLPDDVKKQLDGDNDGRG